MKVSIIIPIYNIDSYLSDCLESCINQTYKNLEIICVNDGSTDRSKQIIQSYKRVDKRIIQIDKINEGLPWARRSGLEQATGEYVFHLDGDDSIPLDTIECLVKVARSTNADIVVGDYDVFGDDSFSHTQLSGIEKTLNSAEYMDYILVRGLYNIWGKLFKRSLYTEHVIEAPADIVMAEDLVACIQLAYYANSIVPCHHICYKYNIRNSSMSRVRKDEVGMLTNKSIKAVVFVMNRCKKFAVPSLKPSLQSYLANFIFVYACSPYSVKAEKTRLLQIISEVDNLYIQSITYTFKRITLKLAKRNLYLAKIFARTITKLIRILK